MQRIAVPAGLCLNRALTITRRDGTLCIVPGIVPARASHLKTRISIFLSLLFAQAAAAEAELPPYVLNWPPDISTVLVADASNSTLLWFERSADGRQQRREIYLSVGENGIGKRREWDRRTPLGVYFITSQLDTSRMHEQYGITAFPLDYPNSRDRQRGRTGHGIWLHGVLPGDGRRPARDTDGCLAIPNEALAELAAFIDLEMTPVVIGRHASPSLDVDAMRQDVMRALSAWQDAWRRGDLAALATHYAATFSYESLDRDAWLAVVASDLAHEEESVEFSEPLLIADPDAAGEVVSRFRLRETHGGASRDRLMRLVWRLDPSGAAPRIIAADRF